MRENWFGNFGKLLGLSGAILGCLLSPSAVSAENYASAERSSAAIGHYARARTMLVEALSEFEEARRLARPDMLIDVEQWRSTIVSRTEDLNRVLDPKPRVTRDGARFKANPSLIRRESERLPTYKGVKSSNFLGEDEYLSTQEAIRARMKAEKTEKEASLKSTIPGAFLPPPKASQEKPEVSKAAPEMAPKKSKEATQASAPQVEREDYKVELTDEDPEIAEAIQQAINERLRQLENAEEAAEAKKE